MRVRQEEQERKEALLRDKESVLEHGGHPYGVQPMGNLYADCAPSIRGGLGAFSPVADQAMLDLLEMLEVRQLGLLTCCSRALYVYCHHADLWRSLVLKVYGGNFEFMSNWKDTFGYCFLKQDYKPHVLRKVRQQASARCCECFQSMHRFLLPVPRSTISNDDVSGRVLLMCLGGSSRESIRTSFSSRGCVRRWESAPSGSNVATLTAAAICRCRYDAAALPHSAT